MYDELKKISVFAFLALSVFFAFFGIFSKEGIIINRDFNFPVFRENFIRYYYPLWNDITSQPNFEQITRLPLRLFLFPLDVSLSLKLLIYLAYLLTLLSMYLYLLEITDRKNCLAICGSLIFTFSPPLLQFMGGISLVYSIGILPLLLWCSHKFEEREPFKWVFLASICLLLSIGHPFILATNIFLFVLYSLLLSRKNWKKVLLTGILFLLFFAWYILPYSQAYLTPQMLGREPIKKGTFQFISDNSVFKIITLTRDKFLYIKTAPENELLRTIWYLFLALQLFILPLPILFIKRVKKEKIKILVLFYFMFLFTTLMSLGSKSPLGETYWIFVSSTTIGWIFRSPLKFQLYQAFAYSVLFTFGLALLTKFPRQKILAITITVMILIGVSGYTLWYANTRDMTPVVLPKEFYDINKILQNIPDDSKVMWYPRYNEKPTTWLNRPVAPFDMKSSKKDTYSTNQNYDYIEEYLYEKIYPNEFRKPEFYDFLRAIGVKYLVFHNDRNLTIDKVALTNIINTLGNKSLVYNSKNWFLFNLSSSNQRVFLIPYIVLSNSIKLAKYCAILIPEIT